MRQMHFELMMARGVSGNRSGQTPILFSKHPDDRFGRLVTQCESEHITFSF